MFKDCREFSSFCVTLNAKSQTHHWEDKHIPPFIQCALFSFNTRYIKNQTHLYTAFFFLWPILLVDGMIFLALPYGPDSCCLRMDLHSSLCSPGPACLPSPFPWAWPNGMAQAFMISYPDHFSGFKTLVPSLFNKFHPDSYI